MNATNLGNAAGWLRRYPFAVACALVVALGTVSALYFWQHAGSISDIHADMEKKYTEMLDTQRGAQALRVELSRVKEFSKRIEDNLLVEQEVADNKKYFYLLENLTQAKLVNCEPVRSPPMEEGEVYRRIPFNLKVSGTYEQVAGFLQGIETGSRLSAITSFAIRRIGESPSTLVMLDLSLIQLGKK